MSGATSVRASSSWIRAFMRSMARSGPAASAASSPPARRFGRLRGRIWLAPVAVSAARAAPLLLRGYGLCSRSRFGGCCRCLGVRRQGHGQQSEQERAASQFQPGECHHGAGVVASLVAIMASHRNASEAHADASLFFILAFVRRTTRGALRAVQEGIRGFRPRCADLARPLPLRSVLSASTEAACLDHGYRSFARVERLLQSSSSGHAKF